MNNDGEELLSLSLFQDEKGKMDNSWKGVHNYAKESLDH